MTSTDIATLEEEVKAHFTALAEHIAVSLKRRRQIFLDVYLRVDIDPDHPDAFNFSFCASTFTNRRRSAGFTPFFSAYYLQPHTKKLFEDLTLTYRNQEYIDSPEKTIWMDEPLMIIVEEKQPISHARKKELHAKFGPFIRLDEAIKEQGECIELVEIPLEQAT